MKLLKILLVLKITDKESKMIDKAIFGKTEFLTKKIYKCVKQ